MTERRFRLDRGAQRFPGVLIGGSPLRLFRLTDAGDRVLDRIASGAPVTTSHLTDALLDAGAIHPDPGSGQDRRFAPGDVTVVVPTLGPPELVPDGPGRVIVVDDGSDPPVEAATIRCDRTGGPAAARNAGLAAVRTPLVAFVDADVLVGPDWLDGLLGHFDDEQVGLVAPRIATAPAPGRLARHDAARGPLDLGAAPGRIRAASRIGYVPAAALVCRVDALRAIGGFDPTLRFGEDVDLVWRLDEAGWRCRYEPTVAVEHLPRPDMRSWLRQRAGYGSSAAPLAIRHPDALAPLRVNGWSLATWLLPLAGRPASGLVVGVGSAAALVPKLPGVPSATSISIGLRGNLLAGDHIARAIRRVYWPLLGVLALRSRLARRALFAAALAAGSPLRLADDTAYSIGVWRGMLAHRTATPLRPVITSWPSRTTARPDGRRSGSARTRYRPRA